MISDVYGKPNFPARMAGWEYQYERAEKAEALAADRLEMNEELESAALKVLCTSLDREKLLRRLVELVDPIEHEPGVCEDCDLVREVMKELGDA